MEDLTHSLNYELPKELHFNNYAQQILENSRTSNLADSTSKALASSPSITSLDPSIASPVQLTTSDFFKKLGATVIHSIQLQSFPRENTYDSSFPGTVHKISTAETSLNNMDLEFGPHHLSFDSNNYDGGVDELQKQLDYDKFMNEVWIGVVLTLILISMIFCFCSCFLYHQFRMWKRNYRTTVIPSTDAEAVKLNMDLDDPVPDYTLVSGLPSYEAALELMHKNPQSCLLVPPSVFEVFNKNEKDLNEDSPKMEATVAAEVSTPLLTEANNQNDNKCIVPSYNDASSSLVITTTPALTYNHSLASLLSLATQKSSHSKSKSTATSNDSEKEIKV